MGAPGRITVGSETTGIDAGRVEVTPIASEPSLATLCVMGWSEHGPGWTFHIENVVIANRPAAALATLRLSVDAEKGVVNSEDSLSTSPIDLFETPPVQFYRTVDEPDFDRMIWLDRLMIEFSKADPGLLVCVSAIGHLAGTDDPLVVDGEWVAQEVR